MCTYPHVFLLWCHRWTFPSRVHPVWYCRTTRLPWLGDNRLDWHQEYVAFPLASGMCCHMSTNRGVCWDKIWWSNKTMPPCGLDVCKTAIFTPMWTFTSCKSLYYLLSALHCWEIFTVHYSHIELNRKHTAWNRWLFRNTTFPKHDDDGVL